MEDNVDSFFFVFVLVESFYQVEKKIEIFEIEIWILLLYAKHSGIQNASNYVIENFTTLKIEINKKKKTKIKYLSFS